MSILVDTHTHIYLKEFDEDRNQVIQRAIDAGVHYMCLPNVDLETIDSLLKTTIAWPGRCLPMMGLHPTSVKPGYEMHLETLKVFFGNYKMIAVGEIGIDLYWDKTWIKEQIDAFRIQIEWAMDMELPVVIHSRNSIDEIMDVLESYRGRGLKGVMHCFPGNVEQANWFTQFGFYIGIGGVVTYKKSEMAKVAREIPLDHIVLETDAPYLTPAPNRGKRNEPSYIPLIAEKIAELRGLSTLEVAKVTSQNAINVFRIKNVTAI